MGQDLITDEVYKELQKIARGMIFKWGLASDIEETMSEVNLAICKAAKNFKPEKNLEFKQYATICIKNSLINISKYKKKESVLTDIEPVFHLLRNRDDTSLMARFNYALLRTNETLKKRQKAIMRDILNGLDQTQIRRLHGINQATFFRERKVIIETIKRFL